MYMPIKTSRTPIPVAILGATGAVGQRFVQLLDNHPWFQVVTLTGSDRAIGQPYGSACHWVLANPMPVWAREMIILPTTPARAHVPIVFSALPADIACEAEPEYARLGSAVCSNASAYRADPDVPILLPEVNPDHAGLVSVQRENRKWSGCITTNPNCTSTGMTVALKALQDTFGIKRVFAVSMQAISGAGYPGVPALDILGNVIPYISGEEEKIETEPLKMLGQFKDGAIENAPFTISSHANRVPVAEGHLVCLSVELATPRVQVSQATQALASYTAPQTCEGLPSAPRPPIVVSNEPARPQPRLDAHTGSGMTTVVGRLRPDPLFDLRLVVLSHNTIRGAAGGSILNSELLVSLGLVSV
jgi:aspartate-semialdehyde dehydrogenase